MGVGLGLRWSDATLPGALAVAGALEMHFLDVPGGAPGTAAEVAACVLLVPRRRWPVLSGSLSAFVLFLIPWIGPPLNAASVPIFVLVLISYSFGRYAGLPSGLVGLGFMGAVITVTYLGVDARPHNWGDVLYITALLGPPCVLGLLMRRLAEQSARLLEQQAWIEREAARGERLRIARDLHDVIAHSVSAMVVQAVAARDFVRADPERAERTLDHAAEMGRSALLETGRLLHALRDEKDELGLAPVPGLRRLDDLLAGFRAQGLDVVADVDAHLPDLPVGVDVSTYRIVQEALTNAFKHAADRTVSLRVTAQGNSLVISTSNACASGSAGGSGLGLAGIKERVAMLGGELEHARTADGRFVLTATLPLSPGEPSSGSVAQPVRPVIPDGLRLPRNVLGLDEP